MTLLNGLQSSLVDQYTSLSEVLQVDERQISIPGDHEVILKVQQELVSLIGLQYVSSCVLGNKTQADYVLQQCLKENSLSSG